MSLKSRQVRDALESIGLSQFDNAVAEALLELGAQPFTPLQVQGALRAAKLPPSAVSDVMDVLDEADPEKQAGFASKLRSKIEAARLAAEAEAARVAAAAEEASIVAAATEEAARATAAEEAARLAAAAEEAARVAAARVAAAEVAVRIEAARVAAAEEAARIEAARVAAAAAAEEAARHAPASRPTEDTLAQISHNDLLVGEKLAEGAFGTVHKAKWKGTPVIVKASKLVSPDPLALRKELETVSKIKPHPSLVWTYGVCLDFPDSDGPRMVLELCEFGSLKSFLSTLGATLEPTFVLDVLVKSATGLAHLHFIGIAHRDFRRDNVLVFSTHPLTLKVADFGLSHVEHGNSGASVTATTIGPVASRAPETFRLTEDGMQVVTLAADVFMFGCFILEVLTGKDPWWFLSDGDLYNTRFPPKEGQAASLVPYRPDANPLDDAKAAGKLVYVVHDSPVLSTLEGLMHRCFAVEPAARPSMQHILDELVRLRDGVEPVSVAQVNNHYIGGAGPVVVPIHPSPVLSAGAATPVVPLLPVAAPTAAPEVSFPSADVIAAMESLGLDDAMNTIGDTILSQPAIGHGSLVALLSSAGVSIPNKAKLLRALTNPPAPVIPAPTEPTPVTATRPSVTEAVAVPVSEAVAAPTPSLAPTSIMGTHVRTLTVRDGRENSGLAISPDGASLAVCNWTTHKVTLYGLQSGARAGEFGGEGGGPRKFKGPQKMCVSPRNGHLLIADFYNKRVQEMTLAGAPVRTIGEGVIDAEAYGIAANADVIAVGVWANASKGVFLFDMTSGNLIRAFGKAGSATGQLKGCTGLRFTPDGGHILISEHGINRLSLFTVAGKFVRCIGQQEHEGDEDDDEEEGDGGGDEGVWTGEWAYYRGGGGDGGDEDSQVFPSDVDFAPNGDILVADGNDRICVYSPDGSTLLRSFGSKGRKPGKFRAPIALAVHAGQLYVLDDESARVQVFT